MKIAVFGTGMVGHTIADKLITLDHEVIMASRTQDNEKAAAWAAKHPANASHADYISAAKQADLIFNCTSGQGTLAALTSAQAHLNDKIIVDLSNPLDFSKGMPPTLFVSNDDSLGERLQRALPGAKVVKALNTINHELMVNPAKLGHTEHHTFICGDDDDAKRFVSQTILQGWFGWTQLVDLGDISGSRAVESYLHLWLRLWQSLGTADFNIQIQRAH